MIRIEGKTVDVVITDDAFGGEEIVVPKGKSVFVPVAKASGSQITVEGSVVRRNGSQERVRVLPKQ